MEEYVTGDKMVNLDAMVWPNLKRARALADLMVSGGQFRILHSTTGPLVEPALRALVEQLAVKLNIFIDMSRTRYEGYLRHEDVGIGSPIDQLYDQVFIELFEVLQRLEAGIETRLVKNQTRVRLLVKAIVLSWLGIVVLSITGIWYHERGRERAEQALQQSQQQLFQAQKMEAVGTLAGGLAHDINNYLGAITGACELVKMGVEPDSLIAAKMSLVLNTVFKTSSLIGRLLTFSRMQPHQLEIVNLSQVIEGLRDMVGRLIGEDIQLTARLAPDLWAVKGDRSQIEQVIVNLVVNAREAMLTGGAIVIETANCQSDVYGPAGEVLIKGGEYVWLSVSDTGKGIPPDIQAKIFEPFFTTKQKKSSGLGLATVYVIVQQIGGTIIVDSEVEVGTTFTIYLPCTTAEPAPQQSETLPGVEGGHERILVVEDNTELREVMVSILETAGYEVLAASEGEEFIELFEREGEEIALVITDVVMPGISGAAVAEYVERRKPNLPVLFMSGYTDNVILHHGIQGSEVNFLQKPFSAGTLTQKVRELVSRRESRT